MTIKSREHALRCAASLPPKLLAHGYPQYSDQNNTLSNLEVYGRISSELAEQLVRCKDDMAMRLILGTSK
jgi:hypothetical protein